MKRIAFFRCVLLLHLFNGNPSFKRNRKQQEPMVVFPIWRQVVINLEQFLLPIDLSNG